MSGDRNLHLYDWIGFDKKAQKSTGLAVGINTHEVNSQLKVRGLFPSSIKERSSLFKTQHPKISPQNLHFFSREMALLLDAGLPLLETLQLVANKITCPKLKAYLFYIHRQVQAGADLHSSLSLFPQSFDNFFCQVIALGEKNGQLSYSFSQLAEHTKRMLHIRKHIKKAFIYPSFILFVSFICILSILLFAVPSFHELFNQLNAKIPASTQMLINLSLFLKNNIYLILLCISFTCVSCFAHQSYIKRNKKRTSHNLLLLKLPIIKKLFFQHQLAVGCQMIATSLGSGLSVLQALKVAQISLDIPELKKGFSRLYLAVLQGQSLHQALQHESWAPNEMQHMFQLGEKSGKLALQAQILAEQLQENLEQSIEPKLKLIEPLLMLGLGGVIGFIILTVYLPIFELSAVF